MEILSVRHRHLWNRNTLQSLKVSPQDTVRSIIPENAIENLMKAHLINWFSSEISLIEPSGYGVVYSVFRGFVAKAGLIEPEEAAAQREMANLGYALPVLDFAEDQELSSKIRREICSVHGVRRVVPNVCQCNWLHSVILMPHAQNVKGFTLEQIDSFIETVADEAWKRGILWEGDYRNVASFQGKLVALDFGDPEREDW